MIVRPSRRFVAVVLAVAVALIGRQAPAQEKPSSRASRAAAIRVAEKPYVDASFGFSIRPLSDVELTRDKRFADGGALELLQMLQYELNWGVSVRIVTAKETTSPAAVVDAIAHDLATQHPDLAVLDHMSLQMAARPAAAIKLQHTADGTEWFRQIAAVPGEDSEFFVVTMNTPLGDRGVAEPLFREMAESFTFLRSEMTRARLEEAVQRGTDLLRKVAADGAIFQNLIAEQYLRVQIKDEKVGYLWLCEVRQTYNRRTGVGLHQEGWFFEDDGTIRLQLNRAFLADDLAYERWDNRIQTVLPEKDNTPMRFLETTEQGVREEDRLVVAFSTAPNSTRLSDRIINVSPSFASATFFTLFPRLVDSKAPALYGFSSYNSERRGLVLRTLRVIGPQDVFVDGRAQRVTRIEDSEGLIPPIQKIDVDPQGRLVRVLAGDMELIATTKAQIEALFGEKMKAAQAAFAKLAQSLPPEER